MVNRSGSATSASSLSRVLHVGRPNVLNRDLFLRRVNEILDSKNFSNNGPFVQQLEQEVRSRLGVAHCVAVSNATIGLEIAFAALELKGKVIMPSFTFVATAHAAASEGLEPVFCDVDPDTGLIDVEKIIELLDPQTSAVVAVNVYGNVCDIEKLTAVCKHRGLRLLFDSAHALGVTFNNQFVGGFGDLEVFSLHATKFVTGFEGGLITTNNDQLAEKLRLIRNFGFSGYDRVLCLGTNAKLSEIHAAMALTNFECMDEIVAHNKKIFLAYKRFLPADCSMIEFAPGVRSNFQYVVARFPRESRDAVVEHLHAQGVLVRKYFYPGVHKFPPYTSTPVSLPNTDSLADSVICFPTGQEMDEATVEYVCELASDALRIKQC